MFSNPTPAFKPNTKTLQNLKKKYGKVVFPSEFTNIVGRNIIHPVIQSQPSGILEKYRLPGQPMTNAQKKEFEQKLASKLANTNTWNDDILTMSQEDLNMLERMRKRTSSDPKPVSPSSFKGGKKTRKARRSTKRKAKRRTMKH